MWDDERLKYTRDNSENPGVLEEILQRHNMTAEHVEVLGQFLDLTGQSPERLKATLRTAFARWENAEQHVKGKGKWGMSNDVNWAWLLLLFLSTLEQPKRREITISAKSNGKSVTITYDPHDAEAVKAAEAWRKALFSAARWAYEEPVAARPGDNVTFTGQRCRDYQSSPAANDCAKPTPNAIMETVKKDNFYLRKIESPTPYMTYLRRGLKEGETGFLSPVLYIGDGLFYDYIGNFRSFEKSEFWTFASAPGHSATVTPPEPGMTPREYVKDAVQKGFRDMQQHIDRTVAAMEPWTPCKRMTELEKASEPLRDYLRAHGDPHTSIVVTQDGATETQDERCVTFDSEKPAETVKSEEPATPEIIANPGNYGVIGFWWEDWADGRCFLRWRTEPGEDAMKVVCLTGNPDCGFQVETSCDGAEDVAGNTRRLYAHSKAAAMREVERGIKSRIPNGGDVRRLTWIRVKEPPKVDLQQLDRAIRALSGVVKDDQSGLQTHFDGVNMSYVLECLKQFREAAT